MALNDCIKLAGKTLSEADRDFLVQELAEGKTDEQAMATLDQVLKGDINGLIDQVEAAGGNIRRAHVTDYAEKSKVFDVLPQDYALTEEDTQRLDKLKKQVPGLAKALKWLQPDEQASILSKEGAEALVEALKEFPSTREMSAVAHAGRAKRGWYTRSQRAIEEVFGEADAPRFTALLAALSPKQSVEDDLLGALKIWNGWVAAGRPTSTKALMRIMAENVAGERGEASVMGAWRSNAFRALTAEDPSKIVLSGPKASSFYLNLLGYQNEVTNDIWMANYSGVDQDLFAGNDSAALPGKAPGYMAMNIAVRKAAAKLGWTAAEVQETLWSFSRTLYNKSTKEKRTAFDILQAGDYTHEQVGSTVDFEQLFLEDKYRSVLEEGGYSLDTVETSVRQRPPAEDRGTIEPTPELNRLAKRLDRLRIDRAQAAMRVEIEINLSAATDSIPGLKTLTQEAMEGNEESSLLLQEVAWDSLKHLTRGIKSIKMTRTLAQGVYKGGQEPSLGLKIEFAEADREKVMGALAKFAKNFNQEQIHVRQPVRYQKLGRKFADGSYITSVLQYNLNRPLTQEEGQRLIEETGMAGMTITDGSVEVYFMGDQSNEAEVEAFQAQTKALGELLGEALSEVAEGRSRIWAYGNGAGATAGYSAIERDVHPPKEDLASDTTRRIASRLAGRAVEPSAQAQSVTQTKQKTQQLIAEQYELMRRDALDDPTVRRAYEELATELLAQFDALPIKVEVWTEDGEVYLDSKGKVSSKKMRQDVLGNNHLYIYKTNVGTFGPEGIVYDNHPMLADSGRVDMNGTPLLINDLLRAVHDYYAHTMSTNTFGPLGEEAAWQNHMMMTRSPWARWALTSETRGQNSWVNFRAGVADKALNERGFSEQKVDLLPLEFLMVGQPDIDASLAELPGSEQLNLDPDYYYSQLLAYHGSGTGGLVGDDLSTRYMSTGEGVQAFGWGLYFSDTRAISQHYKDIAQGAGVTIFFDGVPMDLGNTEIEADVLREIATEPFEKTLAKYEAILDSEKDTLSADRALSAELKKGLPALESKRNAAAVVGPHDADRAASAAYTKAMQAWAEVETRVTVQETYTDMAADSLSLVRDSRGKKVTITEAGGLYRVSLAPKEEEYLLWDVELRDQSKLVQERISKAIGKPIAYIEGLQMTGGDMYDMLSRTLAKPWYARKPYLKGDEAASKELFRIGVRGIKYRDFASRDKPGTGSFNYVIFDDADVTIITQLSQQTPEEATREADHAGDRMSRVGMEHKEVLKRVIELQEAAVQLKAGKLSAAEYNTIVNTYKPIGSYESIPTPATTKEMTDALHSNKRDKVGKGSEIEDGHQVGIRLDIPAYKDHGVWVPTIHENAPGKGKGPIAHEAVVVITNAVFTEDAHAIKFASGEKSKAPSAVIKGEWKNMEQSQVELVAASVLDDPAWVQVGFDPERHSYFYDRDSTMPIESADTVIQIGGLVLAKNPKFGKKEDYLFQKDRARYFPNVADERIIQLTESSDLSSFLHESGHLFLDVQKMWAEKYGANENQEAILEWLEVESWDQIGVEEHERWAETFEVYLREGKAPSLKLRRAFHSFAKWLKRIYVTLTSGELSRADLSPEITEIFDRILATEAEIEENAATPQYQQFYRSQEQAGMTDEAWQAYQVQVKKAKDTAEMNIDEKILKEYKKQKSAEWKAEKAPMIEEEKERLAQEPIYQLLGDLYVEKDEDGKVINETRMDWHKLKEAVGEWPQGNFAGKAVGGGVDPGLYAELYGYESVKDMYEKVNAAPSLKEAAEQAAEQRMKQKHGDILNDGTLEMEVREAMMNEEQAKLLLMELRNENKVEGQKINRKYLKAEAEALIATMKFKDIKPDKYYRAMIKFAQKAMTDADPTEAKLGQLANHYLYKAAMQAKEKMIKDRRRVRKAQTTSHKPNKVDQRYNEAMISLAMAYDVRLKPEERLAYLRRVLDFYAGQVDPANPTSELINLEMMDPNMIEAIRIRMENPGQDWATDFEIKSFDEMTSVELEGVVNMLDHLRYVGGQMTNLDNLEKQVLREAGVESIEENGGKDSKIQRGRQTPARDAKLTWADLWDSIPSIGNMIRKLDGFKPGGWAFENIYQKITAGLNRKLEIQERMYNLMEAAMGDLPSVGLSLRDAESLELESGEELSLSSEEIFMMAVYWGTETSREAIMAGHGLTENDVMKFMERLTPPQLKMVNQVWEMNESQWPELQAAAKAVLGIAPPKLEPTSFVVNGVQMTGGHMQLMYDSVSIELKDEQNRGMKTSDAVPMRAGSTYARQGSGGKPVVLSVHNITQSVEEKTHYIAFAEIGRDLRAILNNPDIQKAIEKKHGPTFYHNLIHAVSAVTAAEKATETTRWMARTSRWMRSSATMMHLAYSLRNVMQQFPAALIAAREVGVVRYVQALAIYASNPKATMEEIRLKSRFMRNRAQVVNREAREFMKKMVSTSQTGAAWESFKSHGFILQTTVDMMVAYPAWYAAYTNSMEKHGEEARAITEADQVVAESVGSGSDLHLGRIMQSNQNEFVKTFTIFGSWFNAYYQRLYKSSKGGDDFLNTAFLMDAVIMPMFVATLTQMIIFDFPDDDEEWWEYILDNGLMFMTATLPLLRDMASLSKGFTPGTPLGAVMGAPHRGFGEIKSYIQGNQTGLKLTADLGKQIGQLVKMPGSGNVWRSLDYLDSYLAGNEGTFNPAQMLLEGSDKND